MKLQNRAEFVFLATLCWALGTLQPFVAILVVFFWFAWEDSKWPAFDSKDFDIKMQKGPLMPWNKGN